MKLERVRILMASLALLALILLPIGGGLQHTGIFYAGLGCFVLAVMTWFFFYRCPHCHKFLGRSTKTFCPYCKERF